MDMAQYIPHYAAANKISLENSVLKIGFDKGQGTTKLAFQLVTGVEKTCSVKNLQVAAVAPAEESYWLLATMVTACNLNSVAEWVTDGELSKIVCCFDLAALPHLYGLQAGQVKFPCVGCLHLGSMTQAEKNSGASKFDMSKERSNRKKNFTMGPGGKVNIPFQRTVREK